MESKWEVCQNPDVLITTDPDFPIGFVYRTLMPHRDAAWMAMHAVTYEKIHDYGGPRYWSQVLITDSPMHIGRMIETIQECKNNKETSLLA